MAHVTAVECTGAITPSHGLIDHVTKQLQTAKGTAFDRARDAHTFDEMLACLQPVAQVENTLAAALLTCERRLSAIINPPESDSIYRR